MNPDDCIHSDPAILCGKPVIRGTRLGVRFMIDLLNSGCTDEQVLAWYPHLTFEALAAVRSIAASR